MINKNKIAQMAAYLIHKLGGEPVSGERLMHLMYAADRESMSRYGSLISGDQFVTAKFGPALQDTLFLMRDNHSAWIELLSSQSDIDGLGWLSESDTEVMDEIVERFSGYSPCDLFEYACNHYQEFFADKVNAPIPYNYTVQSGICCPGLVTP